MPAVTFHFNVPQRREYVCRLLRKAYRAGARVAVTGAARELSELDRLLWTFDPTEFVPHWRGRSRAALPERLEETPIVLVDDPDPAAGVYPVLVNLADGLPAGMSGYERVIEVVSRDEDDRAAARTRWKAYAQAGCPIEKHEVSA